MPSGLVFNLQKYSVHDGPGIRTTVFLKGCPLCCAWCHNPESISPRREIILAENRCLVCGECRESCPYKEFAAGEGVLPTRNDLCTLCEACTNACPSGARQIVGRKMTVKEVMAAVMQDRIFYEDSSGGVTFSGGEPLMQPQFLRAVLEACRTQGLHTTVDTCGFGATEHLLAIAPLTDLFLYDLKLMDDAQHRTFCGVSNALILDNLRRLDQVHKRIWLRVPLIPGVTDGDQNLEAIARFAATLQHIEHINLLPYHKTGSTKAQRVGRAQSLAGVEPPSSERVEQAERIFCAFGLTAKTGG